MKKQYDSALLVKLGLPLQLPLLVKLNGRTVELHCPPISEFTRHRLQRDKTGKGHLRQCGYDWHRAALSGYLPFPRQQQQQGAAEKPPRGGVYNPEDLPPPPKHGDNSEQQPPRDEDDPREQREEKKESPPKIKYSVRQPLDILRMTFDPGDIILENGYLEKGSPFAICGQPGIGKSRLILQLAICCALGLDFLDKWKTNGKGLKWLFLQTENGCRRLQDDLAAMMRELSQEEQQIVHDALFIHTLETDDDGFMRLSNSAVAAGIDDLITRSGADIVVWDPLRDVNIGDINSDGDMGETLSMIARITRKGNIKRIPIIIHHARTGRTGIAKATGWERGDFGRNSKVLLGFVRSQWNIAPGDPDKNKSLLIASGKCNNAEEFEPFGVAFNQITRTYSHDESFDLDAWREAVGLIDVRRKSKEKLSGDDLFEEVVPQLGLILESELARAVHDKGYGRDPAREIVKEWIEKGKIFKHPLPGSKAVWLGRDQPIPTTDAEKSDDRKPKKEDILALVPMDGSIDQDAVISKAASLNPPIGERKTRGFIAELKSDNILFERLIPRRGTGPAHHLSRHEQATAKE